MISLYKKFKYLVILHFKCKHKNDQIMRGMQENKIASQFLIEYYASIVAQSHWKWPNYLYIDRLKFQKKCLKK